jgi:hypothetical protein
VEELASGNRSNACSKIQPLNLHHKKKKPLLSLKDLSFPGDASPVTNRTESADKICCAAAIPPFFLPAN